MIRYYLKRVGVTVSLDSDNPNMPAPIEYAGEESDLVDLARNHLSSQYGAFGHIIGNATTPIDLDAAMRGPEMHQFRPELTEGAELVKVYRANIPDGAVT